MTGAPDRAVRSPDSLLRGPVSTALTLTGPTSMFPAGIVGILRFFFGVRRRSGVDVSIMDTPRHAPSLRPHSRLQDHQPALGSRPSECLRSHDTHMSQK